MRSKRIAVLLSSAILMVTGWMPAAKVVTAVVAGGGVAMVAGCSSDRSEARTSARTEARTSERAEQRVEDRND